MRIPRRRLGRCCQSKERGSGSTRQIRTRCRGSTSGGNVRESRTFLIIDVTSHEDPQDSQHVGAAMINEKVFLKNINGGNVSTYADIIEEEEIRGEDRVYIDR